MSPKPKMTSALLLEEKDRLATSVTKQLYDVHPQWEQRFGEMGRARCMEDTMHHIDYLAEAIRYESQSLFDQYLQWVENVLFARDIDTADLKRSLEILNQAITLHFEDSSEIRSEVSGYLVRGIECLGQSSLEVSSWLKPENPLHEEAQRYLELLLDGRRREASHLINVTMMKGYEIPEIYEHIFQSTQYEIGQLWQQNKITVAHEHYCTAATQLIMSGLYQKIFSGKRKGATMVACSVQDELHEIGVRMVSDFFEMDGWDTFYLGSNVPISNLTEMLMENKADLLALSVTLPVHVCKLESLIARIKGKKELESLKIMVGGYPFVIVPGLARRIGADATAPSAREAVKKANSLLNF